MTQPEWFAYQEETAAFFRSLGLEADVAQRLGGVRTRHDVDVVVRSHHVGFDTLWVVECKQWQTRVSKLHVLALREIVSDLGADRGVLMAERGFQSGAVEAAQLTNIRLSSLAELKVNASRDVFMMRVRDLQDRVDECRARYWAMEKEFRIERGLRPEVGAPIGYSSVNVLDACEGALGAGARGKFPLQPDPLIGRVHPELAFDARDLAQLIEQVEPALIELERRISAAERGRETQR